MQNNNKGSDRVNNTGRKVGKNNGDVKPHTPAGGARDAGGKTNKPAGKKKLQSNRR